MIEYDYYIERVNENRFFKPNEIPTELPNLVLIEGPNSKGKSTLLNIIALSMFGNRRDKLNPSLISKMNQLLDSDHQKLKFSFEITDQNNKTILKSVKKELNDNEILLFESNEKNKFGPPMSIENFESKYNLIYDIPNNPVERLNDLLDELKDEEVTYGNRLNNFHSYLHDLIGEITKYRDPERQKLLRASLKTAELALKELNLKIPDKENFLELYEKYVYIRFFVYYLNEKERIDDKLNGYQEKIDNIGNKVFKNTRRYQQLERNLNFKLDSISQKYNSISPKLITLIPKSEKIHLDIWKSVEIYNVKNNEFDFKLKNEVHYFVRYLEKEIEKLERDQEFKNATAYKTIFEFLSRYEDQQIFLSKVQISLNDIIDGLREEYEKYEKINGLYTSFKILYGNLEELKIVIFEIEGTLGEFKNLKANEMMVEEEIEGEQFNEEDFKKCKELKNEIDKKYDYYSKLCITKNIDVINLASNMMSEISKFSTYKELEPFFSLDEKQTQNKIEEIRKEIKNMNSQIISKNTLIEQYEKELQNFEKQKKHIYEDNLSALDVLLKRVEILSQKLSRDYPKLLKNINDKKLIPNDFEKLYYDEVSKYLGSRIGVFRHIDKTYEAKKIDLRSGIIYTNNDYKIYLSDMGTGQSQSAYLLGLLNIKDDKRKIIALFDEVAMMDDVSMKPIIDKMRNLYNDKKLLIGVIVQMRRGPEVKITSLVEDL